MKRTKTLSAMSFAAYDVERRTRKGSFTTFGNQSSVRKTQDYHSSRRKGRCQYYAEFVSL
ncbi:hypothetical protein [Capnocytophaga canimorsus]|nr:hypothetical protein [Capnocytophaga canimorsus]